MTEQEEQKAYVNLLKLEILQVERNLILMLRDNHAREALEGLARSTSPHTKAMATWALKNLKEEKQ